MLKKMIQYPHTNVAEDDPDDTEKKTCADNLFRENTFLVMREC